MAQLVVVVHMLIQKGRTDEAIAAFEPAIERSHDEPGCALCALHRDIHDPDTLVLIEQWDSIEAHNRHLEQEHVQKLTETVSPLVSELPKITISEALSVGQTDKSLI